MRSLFLWPRKRNKSWFSHRNLSGLIDEQTFNKIEMRHHWRISVGSFTIHKIIIIINLESQLLLWLIFWHSIVPSFLCKQFVCLQFHNENRYECHTGQACLMPKCIWRRTAKSIAIFVQLNIKFLHQCKSILLKRFSEDDSIEWIDFMFMSTYT